MLYIVNKRFRLLALEANGHHKLFHYFQPHKIPKCCLRCCTVYHVIIHLVFPAHFVTVGLKDHRAQGRKHLQGTCSLQFLFFLRSRAPSGYHQHRALGHVPLDRGVPTRGMCGVVHPPTFGKLVGKFLRMVGKCCGLSVDSYLDSMWKDLICL